MKSVIKKYHRYFTNAADTDKKAVIRNDRGRRMEILDRYCRAIGDDNRKAKERKIIPRNTGIITISKYL